jgi:hypothetical protein
VLSTTGLTSDTMAFPRLSDSNAWLCTPVQVTARIERFDSV